jgi:hypothetical protein
MASLGLAGEIRLEALDQRRDRAAAHEGEGEGAEGDGVAPLARRGRHLDGSRPDARAGQVAFQVAGELREAGVRSGGYVAQAEREVRVGHGGSDAMGW